MTWLAWRNSRMELLIVVAMFLAMAAYLVPTGLEQLSRFDDSGLRACIDSGADCTEIQNRFVDSYNSLNFVVAWFHFVPPIVGMLLAAPLIGQIEQRTYRLAWTQSATRGRWLAGTLSIALLGVLLFSLALTALMTWWHAPLDRSEPMFGKDLGQSFSFEGAMPFVYTLFALALALAVGTLTRRLIVAMPVALAGFMALRLPIEMQLRTGYSGPVDGPTGSTIATRSAERFWAMQAVEGAIFLGAAVLLLGVTVWLIRRRG
jgi:hypothetical protein